MGITFIIAVYVYLHSLTVAQQNLISDDVLYIIDWSYYL